MKCGPFSEKAHRPRTSRAKSRRGTTLIEVLAGLVVLGTLLASMAVARGRFMRQWADADRRLQAVHGADALLARWLASPASHVPAPSSGALDGAPGFTWRTTVMRDRGATSLGAFIVRLDVFDADVSRQKPVLSVDFLRHEVSPRQTRYGPGAGKNT